MRQARLSALALGIVILVSVFATSAVRSALAVGSQIRMFVAKSRRESAPSACTRRYRRHFAGSSFGDEPVCS
jgi:hypothetical protein